jgi:hypothetical protein
MKKRSIFGGLNAKLALATVVIASATLTSCEKENFTTVPAETPDVVIPEITIPDVNVNISDYQANATALISITVIDWSNGQVLTTAYQPIETEENGTIKMQQIEVACPEFEGQDNYLSVSNIKVWVPALGKGQAAIIPVTFYVQPVTSVVDTTPEVTVDPATKVEEVKSEAVEIDETVAVSTEAREVVVIENVTTKSGQEVENINEINAYIDALVPATRAYTNKEINAILKALVQTYNTGIKDNSVKITVKEVPANQVLGVDVYTTYEIAEQTITTTIDEKEYSIPGVRVKRVVSSVADVTRDGVSTGGFDNSNNGNDNTEHVGGAAGK